MSLYLLHYDGTPRHVEASSMSHAIRLWKAAMKEEWGSDYTDDDEPESCAILGDEPVIREQPTQIEKQYGKLGS